MAETTEKQREAALRVYAELLEEHRERVEAANSEDVEAAEQAVEVGEMREALLDRLPLTGAKFDQAVEGVRAVAELDDPLGRAERATKLDEGLELRQVRVPIGVLGVVFESRPDAAVQLAALSIRSGNAILLKGGSEAQRTNDALLDLARQALDEAGLPTDAVVPLTERSEVQQLLDLDDLVDLIVPRGSSRLVRFVQENTHIPVLGHEEGVCHTFVDGSAALDQALEVCLDAKLDYPAACNATETFLVHEAIASEFVPRLVEALQVEGVEVRAGEAARRRAPEAERATGEDLGHEFGDLVCALRVVGGLSEAIDHVNEHSSGHTDAILTTDETAADRFVEAVDSAGVYVNASTRFADGYRYGLGAEVGVSTGKTHARGPVGVEGLTTTKWVLHGEGHRAGDYRGENKREFVHEPIEEA
jgi:glutamate-5-semialdehyde dehydrogenase